MIRLTTIRAIVFFVVFQASSTLRSQYDDNLETSLHDSWDRVCRNDEPSPVKRARMCGIIEGAIGAIPPKFWENRLDFSMNFKGRVSQEPRERNVLIVSSVMSARYLSERSVLQVFGDKEDPQKEIASKNDLLREVQDDNAMFFQEKYVIVKQKPGVMLLVELRNPREAGFVCPLRDFDSSIAGSSGPKPRAPEIGIVELTSTCFVFVGKLGINSIHSIDRMKGTVLEEIQFEQIRESNTSVTDGEFGAP